ncbi:MAG: hypothetical protein WCT99_06650 [Bacteroidota bacterium]|jgi:hypothetical protein
MKKKLIFSSALLLAALIVFMVSGSTSQVGTHQYTVNLYSGGRVVATWDAHAIARNEGETLTFFVGSETYPHQVTINGTFSVEQVR